MLRNAADRIDPPPRAVVEAASAALSTRRLDEELAELVADSELVEPGVLRAEQAADGEPRLLSFESGSVSLELQVELVRDRRTLRGLVTGAGGSAEIETADERRSTPIGADGWFTVAGLRGGPLRVRLRDAGGAIVTTGWVLV